MFLPNWKTSKTANKTFEIQSSWATKVSTIGQQALLNAEGDEESQGRRDHRIRRPQVHKAKCLIKVIKTKVSKTLGLATDLTNASDSSTARTLPKAKLTYFSRLTVNVFGTPIVLASPQGPSIGPSLRASIGQAGPGQAGPVDWARL